MRRLPPSTTPRPSEPLTVVLAVRDQEHALGRRVRAMRAAIGRGGRLAAVDLGSTDNSLAVLKLLQRRYPCLSVQAGSGRTPAWAALAQARRGLVLVPPNGRKGEVADAVRALAGGADVAVRGAVVALSSAAVDRLRGALEVAPRQPAAFLTRRARTLGLNVDGRVPPVYSLSPSRVVAALIRAALPG